MIIAGFIMAIIASIAMIILVVDRPEFPSPIELILNLITVFGLFAPLIICGWGLRHRKQQTRRIRILGYIGVFLPYIAGIAMGAYLYAELSKGLDFG